MKVRLLSAVCVSMIMVGCDDPVSSTTPQKFSATGSVTYTFKGETKSYSIPVGAGLGYMLGDPSQVYIRAGGADKPSHFTELEDTSSFSFHGMQKGTTASVVDGNSSDTAMVLTFWDSNGYLWRADSGKIVFTNVPAKGGDTLKGTFTGKVNWVDGYNFSQYDKWDQPLSLTFAIVREE